MIRFAKTVDDALKIIELLREMWAEGSYAPIPPDYQKTLDWLVGTIQWDDGIVLMAEDEDGSLRGVMIGNVQEYFFSHARQAVESVLYVDKTKRGGFTGARLIKTFCAAAKAKGVSEVSIGVSVGIDNELAVGLYRKLGFTDHGVLMRKAI